MLNHIVYASSDQYPIAIIIKDAAFNAQELENAYTKELENKGVSRNDLILVGLKYNKKGKAPVKHIKEVLDTLLPGLASVGTKYIYCADANFFKVLTKNRKAEPHLGYRMKCAIKGYEHMDVILGVNHKSLIYNPANEPKLLLSLSTLVDVINGTYTGLGSGVIKNAHYPKDLAEMRLALMKLHQYDFLAIDLETGSLDFDKAGIGTISFCWSQGEGIAFACDYVPYTNGPNSEGNYGELLPNSIVRDMIKSFLQTYKGRIRWHNAPYDLKILIYELWMKDLLDTEGLLEGLSVVTRAFDDTKTIAYLATNTTAGNELDLKSLAHEFAGNWAMDDIKDIRKIPLPELLEYNLIDSLACNFVFDKHYPIMVQDQQEDLYHELMLPSLETIIQIELTGMPMDPKKIAAVRGRLEKICTGHDKIFAQSSIIQKLTKRIQQEAMQAANEKLKTKQHPIDRFADPADTWYIGFNPNSNPQLQKLLYEEMGLPIIARTKGKQPATGGEVLDKLINHTTDPDYLKVIGALIGYASATKILDSFIPAFERALDKGDCVVWLHGSFNLGGTKSGRLSSSNPNLQNIPAGHSGNRIKDMYGKLIKECFTAPKDWIFCGADFTSLEDYISALTTQDPNKLRVYTEGYDGHCLRAFSYFKSELPGIVDTVASINSIADKFPLVRQKSKAPTFALTYQGTWHTLVKNLGFTKVVAMVIEANYHKLYKVSDQWVRDKLNEASRTGYVTLAFGLRLRTPLLAQTIHGNSATPYEADAEGRTAGNALGQSYGLLNNRAAVAFIRKVRKSKYRLDIKVIALIHDAIYLVIKDNVHVVAWVNKELIKAMEWQNLPELQHNTVKLGAELSLFHPSWANELKIPNNATTNHIRTLCRDHLEKLNA